MINNHAQDRPEGYSTAAIDTSFGSEAAGMICGTRAAALYDLVDDMALDSSSLYASDQLAHRNGEGNEE